MTASLIVAMCAAAAVSRQEPPRIGETVPAFTATALDGGTVSLEDAVATQRLVVVVFLSTACPFANHFGKHLGSLARERAREGVLFIGVNSNESETAEEMAENARAHGQGFPLIRDRDAVIANRLGASCSPEAYVIDHDMRLRYHGWVQSRLRSPDLERALDALVAGRPVRLARTRAFGCAIDRPAQPHATGSNPGHPPLDTRAGRDLP
jgi:peroxiredoxin